MQFRGQMPQSLLKRSEANGSRLQNEIALNINTVAQRDSQAQVQMGEAARRDSAVMQTIAIVTMTFLPGTFVSISLSKLLASLWRPNANPLTRRFSAWNSFSIRRAVTNIQKYALIHRVRMQRCEQSSIFPCQLSRLTRIYIAYLFCKPKF
ncbi:hypothetical protein GQ44DRAFT_718856 [Phaeosphaeriaceae sp. PMI808]|nr:hypothetical protein GQ44DRAFT_718856 [Phaeosphaeriaceae sp. PMI808]